MKNVKKTILDTAFECLSTHGFANVSMRDIAKKSGVALSQLTYYFGTKEKLFLEVIDVMMNEYTGKVEQRISAIGDKEQKLDALIEYFKELIKKDQNLLRLFVDLTAQALWIPSFRKKIDSMFKNLVLMIESHITHDKSGKSNSAAKLIFGALYGTSVQILLEGETEKEYEPLSLAQSMLV